MALGPGECQLHRLTRAVPPFRKERERMGHPPCHQMPSRLPPRAARGDNSESATGEAHEPSEDSRFLTGLSARFGMTRI
jgi:hypothetical protein